jgi:hypothetical protein
VFAVQKHNITEQAGFISSPGYPHYMSQAHLKWTFMPLDPNARLLLEFENIDLARSSG